MLKIIRAGMYTSVQDGGRHNFRQSGISHCGALDKPALNVANLLWVMKRMLQRWKLRWGNWWWNLKPMAGLP